MTRRPRAMTLLVATAIGACSDDGAPGLPEGPDGSRGDAGVPTADASRDDGLRDAREGGAKRDIDGRPAIVQRGEYLVRHVAICGDCHTPRTADGSLDAAKFLAGAPGMFRMPGLGPGGGDGIISPRNLTPDRDTGLGSWTDAEIKKAFLDGIDRNGKALFPVMPYYVLHNMSDDDADAIVSYLRTIPPVGNAVAERNFAVREAAPPIAAAMIPDPTLDRTHRDYESAMRGKYLAGNIGLCMDCHTEHLAGPLPLDPASLFAGGRSFAASDFGFPSPPFPSVIYSSNITPHPSGLEGWTAAAIAALLRQGIDADGVSICPPMPAGPMGSFGGLTDKDARDIGNYVVYLPAAANVVLGACREKVQKGAR